MTPGPGGPAGRPDGAGRTAAPALAVRNPRVQRLRRLGRDPRVRRDEGAYLVEGEKLVTAALAAGVHVEGVYSAGGWDGAALQSAAAAGVPTHVLAPGVLERVSDTVAPQPVLAIVAVAGAELESLRAPAVSGGGPVVVCVEVRDPGNLGTIARSALAAGATGIISCDGNADLYAPKCVRASAGAVFHLRVVVGGAPVEVLEELGSWGMHRLGARATGGTPYDATDLCRPTALVFGNEAHGLSPDVEAALDGLVSIPMAQPAESLNVAAAAAILCFEAARQKRSRP